MTESPLWNLRMAAAGMAFAAVVSASLPLLAAEPASPPAASAAATPEADSPAGASAPPRATTVPGGTGRDDAIVVEVERRFNDLRRELLEDRMKLVDWWLIFVGVFLTFLGIAIPTFGIAGRFGFRKLREIETEARRHLEAIKAYKNEAESFLKELNAEKVGEDPDKASEAAQRVQENPVASPIDRAVAAAILLQRRGDMEGSLEKWRAIANLVDETDNEELGSRAWFSVGYLLQEKKESDLESAIDSYSKAIQLRPDFVEAYNNRGNAKNGLGRHADAIADYDEAIRLKPGYAHAYSNRGVAKKRLDRHADAVADYDEAIRLKPDYADAYNNRGIAKSDLGRQDEARRDMETVLALAREADDETLVDEAKRSLRDLFGEEDP